MELIKHKKFRYSIFSIIYLHQGFIEVYMYVYMALYLLNHGVSIIIIGLTIAIGTSPWIFKIFYGMASDRKGSKRWGRRIPYMIVGSLFAAILFFMLIPVIPLTFAAWILFTSIIFAANFFNALCDTATDGLIIDLTTPEKRGTIQSVCWGSKFVGYVTASLLVGFMIEIFGWTIYFIFMGLFLLIPIPMLLLSRESPYEIPKKFPIGDLKDTFKKRLVWIFLTLFFVSGIGLYIIFSMLSLFLSLELKLELSLVGIVMTIAFAGFLIGCLVSGPIFDKLSRRTSIISSIIFLAVIIFFVSLTQNLLMIIILGVFAGLAWGFLQISEMIIAMDLCKKSVSATTFSIYMSISNLGTTLGALVGAILVGLFGFRIAFVCAAFVVLSTLLPASFIKGTEKLFAEETLETTNEK